MKGYFCSVAFDQNNISYFTLPSFYSLLIQICVLLVHTCLDLFLEVIAVPALSSGKASSEQRHLTRLHFLEVLCKLHAYCFFAYELALRVFSCYREKREFVGKVLKLNGFPGYLQPLSLHQRNDLFQSTFTNGMCNCFLEISHLL